MAIRLLFRIFYSGFFTILNIVLLGLILVTPADSIQQALSNNQLYNVFILAGCHVLTLILAILIYASRLYTTRSVLAAIPKTWIPVEKGDVSHKVRIMIAESLTRSARTAWDARPHASSDSSVSNAIGAAATESGIREAINTEVASEKKPRRFFKIFQKNKNASNNKVEIQTPHHIPVWGEISHGGWSSPESPDLANLQYSTVILELPHLIEAKAVSLAPADRDSKPTPPMPNLRGVELLQRPAPMGLRDYISHLMSIGILPQEAPVATFLSLYENARFGARPILEPQFRDLMKHFADVLRSMSPLNPLLLDQFDEDSDIDGDASSSTTPDSPRSQSPTSGRRAASPSESEGTIRTAPSRRPGTAGSRSRTGPVSTPATPQSRKRERKVEGLASAESFSQTRRPYATSQASSASLRSASERSVINLSSTRNSDDLPYTLSIPTFEYDDAE